MKLVQFFLSAVGISFTHMECRLLLLFKVSDEIPYG